MNASNDGRSSLKDEESENEEASDEESDNEKADDQELDEEEAYDEEEMVSKKSFNVKIKHRYVKVKRYLL